MDALEFARERRRMCSAHQRCVGCDLRSGECMIGAFAGDDERDKRTIAAVEKWSNEHPKKTRQSELLKLFPNTEVDEYGIIDICPIRVGFGRGNCAAIRCAECRKEWWGEEIE